MSTSMEECIHGIYPSDCCTMCKQHAAPPPEGVEYTFTAKYDGRCDACRRPIEVGDTIAAMADGQYWCKDCAS